MKPDNRWRYRIPLYVAGLFLMAMGSIFAVNSKLGVSPVNSLPYALSAVSGIRLGSCVTAVFAGYVLVQYILLRREFALKNLLQIVFSGVFGRFVDFAKTLLGDFCIPTYMGQLLMLCISMLLVAVGLSLYLGAEIVPMPMEGMTQAITQKLGRFPFSSIKIAVDSAGVLLAVGISVVGLGYLDGVREGTVIAAVVTGKLVAVVQPRIRPWINRLMRSDMDEFLPETNLAE